MPSAGQTCGSRITVVDSTPGHALAGSTPHCFEKAVCAFQSECIKLGIESKCYDSKTDYLIPYRFFHGTYSQLVPQSRQETCVRLRQGKWGSFCRCRYAAIGATNIQRVGACHCSAGDGGSKGISTAGPPRHPAHQVPWLKQMLVVSAW